MDTGVVVLSPDPGPPDGPVVHVVGELDLASAPELRDRIARAAHDPGHDVVVDLSGVSFVDCAGLGVLLAAQAQLGSRLSLRRPSAAVLWLIELSQLRAVVRSIPVGAGSVLVVVGSPVDLEGAISSQQPAR